MANGLHGDQATFVARHTHSLSCWLVSAAEESKLAGQAGESNRRIASPFPAVLENNLAHFGRAMNSMKMRPNLLGNDIGYSCDRYGTTLQCKQGSCSCYRSLA